MNESVIIRCSLLTLLSGSLTLHAGHPGIVPVGVDGQPLNLGFEAGTLEDWSAEGKAFDQQPIEGDTVAPRRGDMQSQHAGNYWVGTYEIHGDNPHGTLTSKPFEVTQPWASFLVAGGPHAETRVELVRADNDAVFYKVTGYESENLRPVVVDLKELQGKKIYIRLLDHQSGHWGHINFDEFRLHAQRPEFDNELDPKKATPEIPPLDVVPFAGLSAQRATEEASLPENFSLKVFAEEPNVQQPIAFAMDHRGRLWVAEAYNYPRRAPEGEGNDRILIFEDTDGDHAFDRRKVFIENLNLVSGLEVGFGGVWVGAAPYLMFIPDRDGDDKPDGEPEILLDGWAWQDTHETLNTFTWGPDGWLYGCHGVFTHSKVGKPGTPESERTPINAGIWRYHPIRHDFEVFAWGTSNPWGIDFDDHGQCWIEACVIPHLYHVIQGARYQRQAGQHFNPYVYEDIKTIGDHVHYAGNRGPHAANNRSDAAGGGHAHAGLMVYLGNSWPSQYHGKLFMHNVHGQRINMDIPKRNGSGFVGTHGPDFLNFNDQWSQCINLRYDQDGSVYMIDWYDANQCHHNNPDGHDRSNGRIYKLVYDDARRTEVDLTKASDRDLVLYQLHQNDWWVRHARRLLMERHAAGKLSEDTPDELKRFLALQGENIGVDLPPWARKPELEAVQLRILWALHAIDALQESTLNRVLESEGEYLRSWAVQLLAEEGEFSRSTLQTLARMAGNDPSPVVRLYLASALQRMPVDVRTPILEGLVSHGEDAEDHNLPLMYWYALEPLVAKDTKVALKLMNQSKIPLLRQYITRRMASQ